MALVLLRFATDVEDNSADEPDKNMI